MIVESLKLLAANACFLAAGLGVVRAAGGWRRPREASAVVGLSYVAGVAVVGTVATLMLVAGLSLALWQVLLLCLSLFLLGFLARGGSPPPALREQPSARPILAATVALGAAFVLFVCADFFFQPLSAWDAWQQWTAKARSFVLLGGLDPAVFAAPLYLAWNPDYPLLVPALEAIDFRFMGLGTQVIHLQFGLLLVGLAFAIRDLLASRVRPLVLWPMLLVVLLLPAVAVQAGSAQADIPLGVFVALATVCAWVWLREADRTALALLGLFSAAGLATKLDATVYLGALFLVLVILVGRRSLRRAAATVAVGAAALVGIVPWRIWVAVHDVPGYYSAKNVSPTFLADEWRRIPLSLQALLEQALAPGNWLFAVPLALLAAALAVVARGDADGLLLVGAVVLSLAGLVFVYWVTPIDFFFHLGTSTSRVVVPLVLACAALAPALIGEALERRPRPAMRA